MKKALIVTLYGNMNYGNKLQNYAVYKILLNYGITSISLKNSKHLNYKRNMLIPYIKFFLSKIKYIKMGFQEFGIINYFKRLNKFRKFNNTIPHTKHYFNYKKIPEYEKYNYLIVGSDQVWNPKMALDDLTLFSAFNNKNKIALSASIALNKIDDLAVNKLKENLHDFKAISLREEKGVEIIKNCTGRKDVKLLLDPTMILPQNEWNELADKSNLNNRVHGNYILMYFLSNDAEKYKESIKKFAKNNHMKIIDIYDKHDKWITSGPYDFLFLEKNAKLICTDSFHSAVFGIIFNSPILVFDRDKSELNMNSRIETLLNKFDLKHCKYNGNLKENIFETNYNKANKILEKEQKNNGEYLKKALDLK